MKSTIAEHLLSLIFVSIVMITAITYIRVNDQMDRSDGADEISKIQPEFADLTDPFQRALLKDVLDIYYPGQQNENIYNAILHKQTGVINTDWQNSHVKESLSITRVFSLMRMYLKFILIYLIVMAITYYGVQTLGVVLFIRKKGGAKSRSFLKDFHPVIAYLTGLIFKAVKILLSLILFSPAYVLAYSIRTEFNTDTLFFLVLLAVLTNGLLIIYAQKFYTFLLTESRKGYVETAVVKNLNTSFLNNSKDGISWGDIFRIRKRFRGHILDHIYTNAQHQYLTTLKEQSSFLITGLIIIEMALNIHGYLSYEMLRQILYSNYEIVIAITLGIFYVVKFTEIATDWLVHKSSMRYENRQ